MRQNPNAKPLGLICKCGRSRAECVCVIQIAVKKPLPEATIKKLKELLKNRRRESWDEIDKEFTMAEGCAVSLQCESLFKWLKENYHPPRKIK